MKGDFSVSLTYECDCLHRVSEARKHCKYCGRENPYWVGEHGLFGTFTLSEASVKADRERKELAIIEGKTAKIAGLEDLTNTDDGHIMEGSGG